MDSSGRNYAKYFFIVLAIITAIAGFFTVTIWNRAFTPDLYLDALDQANFYGEATTMIESQFTFYLEEKGKEIVDELLEEKITDDDQAKVVKEVSAWVITTIIENQTGTFVSSISDEINLEENLELSVDAAIIGTLAWVRGDINGPQVFSYIPSPEEVEAIGEQDNASILLTNLAFRALGYDDLDQCSNDDAEIESLTLISSGNWKEITCTSDKVDEALVAQIELLLPKEAIEKLTEFIDENLDTYRLETLLDGAYEILLSVSQLKEDLQEFRTEIQAIRYIAIGLIFLSAIFTAIAVFFSQRRSLKTVLKIYLIVGLALMTWGLIFNSFGTELIENRIDSAEWTLRSDAISTADSLLMEKSVESTISYIADHIHDYTIEIGFMLVLFMGIPLLIWTIYDRGGKEKGQEAYAQLEDIAKSTYDSAKQKV